MEKPKLPLVLCLRGTWTKVLASKLRILYQSWPHKNANICSVLLYKANVKAHRAACSELQPIYTVTKRLPSSCMSDYTISYLVSLAAKSMSVLTRYPFVADCGASCFRWWLMSPANSAFDSLSKRHFLALMSTPRSMKSATPKLP